MYKSMHKFEERTYFSGMIREVGPWVGITKTHSTEGKFWIVNYSELQIIRNDVAGIYGFSLWRNFVFIGSNHPIGSRVGLNSLLTEY